MVNSDFSQYRMLDYVNNHISDGMGGAHLAAVRIDPIPEAATINTVNLKMYDAKGTLGNYPSGTPFTVSIHASIESGNTSIPAAPALTSVIVDSGTIPRNGWFTVPGFSFVMSVGVPYHMVWSSPAATTGRYVFQRNVTCFRALHQMSFNGGSTWQYESQGPTDLAWYATLSDGSYVGSPYDHWDFFPLSPTQLVAQPFVLYQASSVNSVFAACNGGIVSVSIYPDNGSGTGPNMTGAPLGTGTINTIFGESIISFRSSSTPLLLPNVKYWAVFSNSNEGAMIGASYWTRPTDPLVNQGYEALISSNGGIAWTQADPGGEVATAIFMVGTQPSGTITQTPTTVTVSARPH
jgi:hypothetical protein